MSNKIGNSVKLISVTQPIIDEAKTPEELIVYVARVSNPNNQSNMETASKLLRYLINNKHWSPFEQVSMTVEISTSRAIAAQILRHRSFVFQEWSQRYTEALNYIPYDARRQDNKNRQNSFDDLDDLTKARFLKAQENVWKISYEYYKTFLDEGIAKECVRFLLPLNTETKLYMTGTIRSYIHYLQVRTDLSTQKEHRVIANAIKDILIDKFPMTCEALVWNK